MKIVHFADVHIRNHKYRKEYREAFEDLYQQIEKIKPDLVINAGDTVHGKLNVSPELFADVSEHMRRVSQIAPYWLILGNHDLNLRNPSRLDAISPIVEAMQGNTANELILMNSSGFHRKLPGFDFWGFDIRGVRPERSAVLNSQGIKVGIYHGSLSGCITDQGFTLEHGESEVSQFDDFDFVLMGDIHQRQEFREGRVRYPGSLIQQNYGEIPEKGFLVWDIRGRDEFDVTFCPVRAPGRFHTVQVSQDLDVSNITVPLGSRLKVITDFEMSPSIRMDLDRKIREKFKPLEVIVPDAHEVGNVRQDIDTLFGSRNDLIKKILSEQGKEGIVDQVLEEFGKLEQDFDRDSDVSRGTCWSLDSFAWDNMMNYGAENSISLSELTGLVGIFAPNAAGKSSIFEILTEGIFDRVTKDVPKNVDLINDNKDQASITVELSVGETRYRINRQIEKIAYDVKKNDSQKQWGKTKLDFYRLGDEECLNGDTRPETERQIRKIFGSFEDFMLMTMIAQSPITGLPGGGDIIACKETERRRILSRMLDIDIFEKVHTVAKDRVKSLSMGLTHDPEKIEKELEEMRQKLHSSNCSLLIVRGEIAELRESREKFQSEIDGLRQTAYRDKLKNLIDDLGKKIDENELKLNNFRKELEMALGSVKAHSLLAPTFCVNRDDVEKIRKSASDVALALSSADHTITMGSVELKKLGTVPCGDSFPGCRFITDAHRFRDESDELLNRRESLRIESERIHGDLTRFQSELTARESWEKGQAKLDRLVESIEKKISDLEAQISEKRRELTEHKLEFSKFSCEDGSSERLRSLQDSVRDIEERLRTLLKSEEKTVKMIGGLEANIVSQGEILDRSRPIAGQIKIFEELTKICGKDGIPFQIVARVLPLINHEIENILQGIVKFSVFFEEDEGNIGLYIRYGDFRRRPLSLGSGAERFISALAIRNAISTISSLPKSDFLIIDEGFGKLDPEYIESIQRMLEKMKSKFHTIFMISHVDVFRDIVDHSIEIINRDGYAHVES